MRIQKLLLVLSITGLSTFLAIAQSSNSEAQEKALKTLREKMKELDSAKPATPAPVSKPQSTQKPAPPVATTKKRVEAAAPAPSVSGDPQAQAKAMEAMRKKQAELDAQAAKKTVKDEKAEAARLAKAKKEAEESARKAQATAAKEPPKTKKPAVAPVAAVASPAPRTQALPAAVVGLSADQVVGSSSLSRREKLDALLRLYLADTISPREYHQHRAAIVALP